MAAKVINYRVDTFTKIISKINLTIHLTSKKYLTLELKCTKRVAYIVNLKINKILCNNS